MKETVSAIKTYGREIGVAATILAFNLLLLGKTHGYFTGENLTDLLLANMPVMIIALGMLLVILTGRIDISIGSQFAVCSVLAGVFARDGASAPIAGVLACAAGALCGAINGSLVAWLRVPSIVVTLATMIALRDGLRWVTQGAWVGGLPSEFQWFHLSQASYTALIASLVVALIALSAFGLRNLRVGRAVFAVGSNE